MVDNIVIEREKPFAELAQIYDELMEEDFYERMIDYLGRVFEEYSIEPGRVLDLACGTGRFSLHLAGEGWAVTGLDKSAQMIKVARQHTKETELNIRFVLADMVDFSTNEQFDTITCFYDSINYILDEERLSRLFKWVKQALAPAGYFIFDLNTLHGLKEYWNTSLRRRLFLRGQSIWMTCWNEETKINTLKLIASFKMADGSFKRLTEIHRERGYPNETVVDLLKQVGFRSVDIFDCFSFAPDDGIAGKVMVIAN